MNTLPTTTSLEIFAVGQSVVSATRRGRPESSVPGAEHWGYRVVSGPGLLPEEAEQVHAHLRALEAGR